MFKEYVKTERSKLGNNYYIYSIRDLLILNIYKSNLKNINNKNV